MKKLLGAGSSRRRHELEKTPWGVDKFFRSNRVYAQHKSMTYSVSIGALQNREIACKSLIFLLCQRIVSFLYKLTKL